MGGISWSSTSVMAASLRGSIWIFFGVLYKFPGALFHCWPSPRSIGSFTVWPFFR